jgi:DNA-binding CsgD family transcriptional regulator
MQKQIKHKSLKLSNNYNTFLSNLIGVAQEGTIVVSRNLQPIYLNLKAKEICRQIWHGHYNLNSLPPVISDLHQCLVKNYNYSDRVFVVDYQVDRERVIRIRVSYLAIETEEEPNLTASNSPWLLISLEDRSAILRQELHAEQKKYNLTNRETEIWKLLSQSYTYQDIAQKMQVSLNTVKFHAKNIYAKKRICQEPEMGVSGKG